MHSAPDDEHKVPEEPIHAYDRMVAFAKEALDELKEKGEPAILRAVETAKEKLVEIGELTRQDAEKTRQNLLRDLHDSAEYLALEEREFADWLRLDLLLVEKQLLHRLAALADQARLELAHVAKSISRLGEWHTGEIRSIGILQCAQCGQLIHFHKTGRIPPCPKCQGTVFKRARG